MKGDYTIDITVLGIMLAICIVILGILAGINDGKWNDGHCSCGGNWVYEQPIGHMYSTYYLYECDSCGKCYEFRKKR